MISLVIGDLELLYCLEFRDILACLYYRDNENILLFSPVRQTKSLA